MIKLMNCKLNDLPYICEGKIIYVFGCGTYVDDFCKRNPEIGFEKYIKCFVETEKKQNNKYLMGSSYNILSLSECSKQIKKNDIIVIASTTYYLEMLEQLDGCDLFENINGYLLNFIEGTIDETIDWDLYNRIMSCNAMIPRKIHYCWFGKGEIPYEQRCYIDGWKQTCPEYEIIQWNEDNYDISKNSFLDNMYNQKKWAFISDYARMDIIHEFGGVYFDTDVELIKPLDELMRFSGFMGRERKGLVASGLGFGSVPKNAIIGRILNRYHKLMDEKSDMLGKISCPLLETQVLKENGLNNENCFQYLSDCMAILPTSFLGGMNRGTFRIDVKNTTFSIHHYAGSWSKNQRKEQIIKADALYNRCKNAP